MERAPSLDLAADGMTKLMIWGMVKMGPFQHGNSSFLARATWDQAQLRPLDSLCNLAS